MAKGSPSHNDYPLRVLAQLHIEGPHYVTGWWVYDRKTRKFVDPSGLIDGGVEPANLKVRFHDMNDGRAIRIINNAKKGG